DTVGASAGLVGASGTPAAGAVAGTAAGGSRRERQTATVIAPSPKRDPATQTITFSTGTSPRSVAMPHPAPNAPHLVRGCGTIARPTDHAAQANPTKKKSASDSKSVSPSGSPTTVTIATTARIGSPSATPTPQAADDQAAPPAASATRSAPLGTSSRSTSPTTSSDTAIIRDPSRTPRTATPGASVNAACWRSLPPT